VSDHRGLEIGVVAAVAVAAVGLWSGVESSSREVASYRARGAPSPAPVAPAARSYRDMRVTSYGPNAGLPVEWWKTLRGGDPDLFAPMAPQTPEARAAALARRAGRRAFDGAPPAVPHAVDQIAVPACVACHGGGVTVAGIAAPVMSHPPHDSCLQCHVTAADPRPGAVTPAAPDSSFVGLAAPGGGERAWDGAPPTIPHPTWMRERCDSCHGTRGLHGVRSTHPWRQVCTQCHAPSATLDQRPPVATGAAP
jgi:cytochrome c-type protein NapB